MNTFGVVGIVNVRERKPEPRKFIAINEDGEVSDFDSDKDLIDYMREQSDGLDQWSLENFFNTLQVYEVKRKVDVSYKATLEVTLS